MAELPPPPDRKGGWYPDPEGSGRLRWWGGQQWSDRFKDAPYEPKPSSGGDPGSPNRRGQWGGAPWWAWVLGAIVALIILGALVGGDESRDDRSGTDTATEAAQAAEESGTNAEDTTASEVTTEASCGTEATDDCTPDVGPNRSVRVDALIWRVTGAHSTKTLGDVQYGLGAKADGIFVVVDLQVRSDKDESATLTDPFQLDIGGNIYDPDNEGTVAAMGAGDEPLFLEDIGPDATVTGPVVFDVPPEALSNGQPKMRFNELGFGTSHAYIALPPL